MREYAKAEVHCVRVRGQDGHEYEQYRTLDNQNWLFLAQHPVTGKLVGISEGELDPLREDFVRFLRAEFQAIVEVACNRKERVEGLAGQLYALLRTSPPGHDWLRLPSDSRPGRDRCTLAYHALLVSAFACALVRELLARGRSVSDLLRFQVPVGEAEQPLDEAELIHLTRLASLCHDFGKQPPQRHNVRGAEQVGDLFRDLLDPRWVDALADVARRHHTGSRYAERGEAPLGLWETLIAHADTLASGADRPDPDSGGFDPLRQAREWLQAQFGTEEALSLISADTDRVKGYVFESARLPEVRGASAQLTMLNEEEMARFLWECFTLPPECLLYNAGGGALIIAPTSLAGEIAEALQQLYLEETGVATLTVVHHPFRLEEWQYGVGGLANLVVDEDRRTFGGLVTWLGYRLRRAKESRPVVPFYPALPQVRRCDSCETRPAARTRTDPDGDLLFVCEVCYNKREVGLGQKSSYIRDFERFLNDGATNTPYGQWLQEHGRPQEYGRGAPFAQTLSEIADGAVGKAAGYVGVIYTDGNGIGQVLEKCQTPADYRTLSAELSEATRQATFEALADWPPSHPVKRETGNKEWLHPLEIITIGGDDVFLIVPGDVALDIAISLCEKFGQRFTGEDGRPRLTMSAGVLIMPAHYPMYFARDVAEALLKNAKKAGRKAGQDPPPAMLDFQVITGDTSLGKEIKPYRDAVYTSAASPPLELSLHERPYDLDEARRLLQTAKWAKGSFPASQLYQLRRALVDHGVEWARNWYRYQLARSKEGSLSADWHKLHGLLFGTDPFADQDAPWRHTGNRWSTPVVDLVEIFDYVRPSSGDGKEATHGPAPES